MRLVLPLIFTNLHMTRCAYLLRKAHHDRVVVVGNQAYSRLSTTHGHISNCKLDSVVYAGVGVVI